MFSRIWTSLPIRTGPCESPMILTPAPMIDALADDDVAGDLGTGEHDCRVSDGRQDASVGVELAHGGGLRRCSDGRGGVRGE